MQRELEVLSEQYSQKCLENAHLAQALEAERQALRQCQRENQELNAHNQELNNRLAAEIARLRTLLTGDASGEAAGSPLTQGKDAYELEVLLGARPPLHPALHRTSPKWGPRVVPSSQSHYRDEIWR